VGNLSEGQFAQVVSPAGLVPAGFSDRARTAVVGKTPSTQVALARFAWHGKRHRQLEHDHLGSGCPMELAIEKTDRKARSIQFADPDVLEFCPHGFPRVQLESKDSFCQSTFG